MISTQSTGDRRLTPSQREALGKFVPNPFPPAQKSTPVRQASSEPLPMRPHWLGWRYSGKNQGCTASAWGSSVRA